MDKVSIKDVKNALRDSRFRAILPSEMSVDIDEYLKNPGCPCHLPFYQKIIKNCKDQLSRYYPGREISDHEEELKAIAANHWRVINCHITELESKLAGLGPGRKQLDVARWQDQVTVVINELDVVF